MTRQHTVPTIDLSQLPPYLLSPMLPLYLQGADDVTQQCHCHLQLSIPVIKDDDPTVDLEARWFVDYDLNGSSLSQRIAASQTLQGSFTVPALTRGPVPFELDGDAQGFAPNTIHVVEVVIAESQGFAPDSQVPAPVAPHRSLVSGWDGTVLKFVVNVLPSSTRQCDGNTPFQSPPLIRVCP